MANPVAKKFFIFLATLIPLSLERPNENSGHPSRPNPRSAKKYCVVISYYCVLLLVVRGQDALQKNSPKGSLLPDGYALADLNTVPVGRKSIR